MNNILYFALSTNVTHYSKENYSYFLYLKNIINDINYDKSSQPIKKSIHYFLKTLMRIKCNLPVDDKEIQEKFSYMLHHLRQDEIFEQSDNSISALHILLLEFYKFNFYHLYKINKFILQHTYLCEDTSLLMNDGLINLLLDKDQNEFLFQHNFQYNNGLFNILKIIEIYSHHISKLLPALQYFITSLNVTELLTFYYFLLEKLNLDSKALPYFIFNKILSLENHSYIIYNILILYFKYYDYHLIEKDIVILYPSLKKIYEEYQTQLTLENF